MHVLILRADIHLPASQSLKEKRSLLTPILRHIDSQTAVAAAEVDFTDKWQRAAIGVSAVGASVSHLEHEIDAVERFLWSRLDIEVLELTRSWWDEE